MPITYTYDASRNLVEARARGHLTTADFRDYTSQVLADARIRAGFIEVVEVDGAASLDIRSSELPPFRLVWKSYLRKGVRGTLIHAESDAGFATFRMFQSTIDAEDLGMAIDFELVRSRWEVAARIADIRARFPLHAGGSGG